MSAYGVFARWYDALTVNTQPKERAEYLRTLLCRLGHPSGSLLDLACGTGSVTLELARAGYDITAADLSADMLAQARMKFDTAGLDALFLQQDMRELDLFGTVDCAICTLDSLNHLTEGADVARVFGRVSLFLNPGGVFIFDVNSVYKHNIILAENTFVYELDGLMLVWRNSRGEASAAVDMQLDFFEKEGALWRRYSEEFTERAYPAGIIASWLTSRGFEEPAIYGDFSFDPPAREEQRLIFAVRKAVPHG